MLSLAHVVKEPGSDYRSCYKKYNQEFYCSILVHNIYCTRICNTVQYCRYCMNPSVSSHVKIIQGFKIWAIYWYINAYRWSLPLGQ